MQLRPLWCRHLQEQHIRTSVVQTRVEAKRRESFDNDVFFDITSEANTFNCLKIFFEASKLILNCEFSEAKQTCSIVKSLFLS